MGIDRYSKVVLTVIAACLVWLSAGGQSIPTVHAQQAPPHLFTGSEIGYRVEQFRPGQAPTGNLVVQIDGLWYEARLVPQK
jgi:hypothetical protein